MNFQPRNCPSCAAESGELEICSDPKAEQASWSDLQQSWSGFFKSKLFFTYKRCTACGLLYCPQYFDNNQLGELYGSMPDNTAGLGAERTNLTQSAYVRLLDKHSDDGDFLELGPDIGLFTVAYAKRFDTGSKRKYWLFEPNRRVHAELTQRMGSYRHEIRTELFDLSAVPDNTVSTTVMIHVLDHLLDPLAMLKELKRKMKSGAMIYIVTHNERSFLARSLRKRWPAFCLQHPQLFNPKSIEGLLVNAGFRVCASRKTVNYFPASYLAQHALYLLGINLAFVGRIRSPMIGLRLGNMLTSAVV